MALNPLHRLWRALPQEPRRRLLHRAAETIAPRPDRPAPPARRGIAVGGELGQASGLGEGARILLHGLDRLGVPNWPADPRRPPPDGAPIVLHVNPAALPLAMLRLGRTMLRGRRIIGLWPWELPVIPPAWRSGFGFVHEVWAPSQFSAAAIRRAMPAGFGCSEVRVVPYPLACHPPAPAALGRAELGLPDGAVITLVAFNLASSFDRKNPLAAIAAHRAAFGARPDRVLLIRVGNPHHFPADFARLQSAAGDLPNVMIETAIRPRDEAHAVMAAADIVLSLHRSEGFGLVPAEAMLLGKAVVATAWSGTEDFLDDRWAVRVPATLVPARDSRAVFQAEGAVWAEPDIEAAAASLVALADDPGERERLGAAAQIAARTRFGPAPLAAAISGFGQQTAT